MTKVLFLWHHVWAATRHRKYDYHLLIDTELEFIALLDPLLEAYEEDYGFRTLDHGQYYWSTDYWSSGLLVKGSVDQRFLRQAVLSSL